VVVLFVVVVAVVVGAVVTVVVVTTVVVVVAVVVVLLEVMVLLAVVAVETEDGHVPHKILQFWRHLSPAPTRTVQNVADRAVQNEGSGTPSHVGVFVVVVVVATLCEAVPVVEGPQEAAILLKAWNLFW